MYSFYLAIKRLTSLCQDSIKRIAYYKQSGFALPADMNKFKVRIRHNIFSNLLNKS